MCKLVLILSLLFCINNSFAHTVNEKIERTLSIIKSDAVRRNIIGPVQTECEKVGKVVAQKMLKLTKEEAVEFYAIHKEKSFFEELCNTMSSDPIVVQVLEGPDVIRVYRQKMGATDPKIAKRGTIRKKFGISKTMNTVHGSDSEENAKKEIAFFFSSRELM